MYSMQNNLILYTTQDKKIKVELYEFGESVYLTQDLNAKLFLKKLCFNASFSVLALSDKPELISTEKGTLELLSNANLSPFDKALNLALQSGKTLDKPLKTIFENRLCQCEDCLYLIACNKEVLEFLRKSQNEYIFIDGFEDVSLEDFLNLDSSLSDRLRVVY